MTVAAGIDWALPQLQAEAEARMTDSCVITRGDGEKTWDEATGTYTHGEPTQVYEGRCRLRAENATAADTAAGDASYVVTGAILSLPVSTSGGVREGDDVIVTTSQRDASLVGRRFVLADRPSTTDATARRFRAQEVTDDARRPAGPV